jgi:hypothetical protein
MNESEKGFEEVNKKVDRENLSKTFAFRPSGIESHQNAKNFKRWVCDRNIKNSDPRKHEHDMLQANQAHLKSSYADNIKQVISINSTIHERYQKLQKISLQHILSKGNYLWLYASVFPLLYFENA